MKATKLNSKIVVLAYAISLTLINNACGNKSTYQANKANTSEVQVPKTPIHEAAFMGNLKAIEQHILAKSDLNVKDQYGSTPLAIAITFNRPETAKALINGGADLNIKGPDGSTPLHTAAFLCRKEIVIALVANGANKNAINNYNSTPRQSVLGSFETVKAIYEQLNKDLGPLGFKLNYDELQSLRPEIAELLN